MPKSYGLGFGNGRIIEYQDGTAGYVPSVSLTQAFRVRIADVTGFSVTKGDKMLQRTLNVMGNGTMLGSASVNHGTSEAIEGWFRSHPLFGASAATRGADLTTSQFDSPSPASDRVAQLKTLADLRASGALTPDEFESEKQRVLQTPNQVGLAPIEMATPSAHEAAGLTKGSAFKAPSGEWHGTFFWLARRPLPVDYTEEAEDFQADLLRALSDWEARASTGRPALLEATDWATEPHAQKIQGTRYTVNSAYVRYLEELIPSGAWHRLDDFPTSPLLYVRAQRLEALVMPIQPTS